MYLLNDSLTVVLIGDWNKLFIQPDWIAQKVFDLPEMEVGIESQGTDLRISYCGDGIIMHPTQEKVVFTATNTTEHTVEYLVKCVNNFLSNAYTPKLSAYGFNADFVSSETGILADILDSISDTNTIIEAGYEIIGTKVSRVVRKGDVITNISCVLDGTDVSYHFNEHHDIDDQNAVSIDAACCFEFLSGAYQLLEKLGYEMDGGEDE